MKALFGSFGFGVRNRSSLEGLPKPSTGIIPYAEEEKLLHLWIELMKSEEGCRKLMQETQNHQESLKNIQDWDELFVQGLSDAGALNLDPDLRECADEYLTVTLEVKSKSNDTCTNLQQVLDEPLRQYHGLYQHLEPLRKKRDAQLLEVQRLQDKYDRLKIKGKRTTDIIVEKERAFKVLKDLHILLYTEAAKFHNMRASVFLPSLQASVQLLTDYYGTSASEFSKQIHISRGANLVKEPEYFAALEKDFEKIKGLQIVK